MKGTVDTLFEIISPDDHDRERDQCDQGELPITDEHIRKHTGNGQEISNNGHQPVGKYIVDGFNIIDGPGGEGTDGRLVELREIEVHDLLIGRDPHIFYHRLAKQGCGIRKKKAHGRFYQDQPDLDQGDIDEHGGHFIADILIHGQFDQQWTYGCDQRQQNGQHHREVKLPLIGCRIAEYPFQQCKVEECFFGCRQNG